MSTEPNRAKVIKDYTAEFSNPLKLRAGGRLTFERKATVWLGWLWCTSKDGNSGWVPESYVRIEGDECSLRRDYDATELSVTAGETLQIGFEESEWLWCRNQDGAEGWVPKNVLADLSGASKSRR